MPLGHAMEILICQYQLWVGIQRLILEDTHPCPWIPDCWLSHICQTMNAFHITIRYEAWTIPAQQNNDVFIMEAIEDLGLTISQMEQINACRMFLKITTLAKITDHTSTSLLPQAFLKHPNQAPLGLQEISTSMLTWPRSHCPTKTSWKLWHTTICNLFTRSQSNMRLTNPLGVWTMDYQKHCWWHWQLAHTGRLLHQATTMPTPCAAIQVHAQQTQLTFSPTIPTNQPFDGPPVTPSDTYHRVIELSTPSLPNGHEAMPTWYLYKSITAQFQATLAPWKWPLFGPIMKMQPTARLQDTSRTRLPLLLVSNVSVQKNKQSSFTWIITHNATTLWKGIGLAPGTADNIYSGWAEAFGLLTGLLFLQHYIESYDPSQFTDSPLHCFCNNASVITNVNDLMTSTCTCLNDTTNNNQDVFLVIIDALSHCRPLQIQLFHVKGHQDKDPKCKLTLPEQLNIACNHQAKLYAQTATQSSTALGNPAIPAAQLHLFIAGNLICRKVIPHLCQATSIHRIIAISRKNLTGQRPMSMQSIGKFYHWRWNLSN